MDIPARRILVAVALITAPVLADGTAGWGASNDGGPQWTNSVRWGLDPACNMHPVNNMIWPSCRGQNEPRWHATVDTSSGPVLDVSVELMTFTMPRGSLNLGLHTMTVLEQLTLGDGNSNTSAPVVHGNGEGTLVSVFDASVLDNVSFQIEKVLNQGEFVIEGTAVWATLGMGCLLRNTGTLWLEGDGSIRESGNPGRVENDFFLFKTLGGVSEINVGFTQTANGVMEVDSGVLALGRTVRLDGLVKVRPNAVLEFDDGGFDARIDGDVSADGTVFFGLGRTVNVNGPYRAFETMVKGANVSFHTNASFDTLSVESSQTRVSGNLTVSGEFHWNGGRLAGAQLDLSGDGYVGHQNWADILDRSTIGVRPQATLHVRDRGLRGENGSAIDNEGQMFIHEDANLLGNLPNAATLNNTGSVVKGGPGLALVTFAVNNRKLMQVIEGTLGIGGDFEQYGHDTNLELRNGAEIQMFNFEPLDIDSGALLGDGTIIGHVEIGQGAEIAPFYFTSNGRVQTGELIIVAADLTLSPASRTTVLINGRSRGGDYSAITTTSNIRQSLAGLLQVVLGSGFANSIQATDTFVIYQAGGAYLEGVYYNALSGTRVSTFDGKGSFVVYYGQNSPYPANQVVLTDYRPISPDADNAYFSGAPLNLGNILSRNVRIPTMRTFSCAVVFMRSLFSTLEKSI